MRKGFTMIELLLVIVIIGVLAGIAGPRYLNSKRHAYIATMKSDLRNLVSAAETQFVADGTYATFLAPRGSADVTLVFVGSQTEWQATATHAAVSDVSCHIERGTSALTAIEPICE